MESLFPNTRIPEYQNTKLLFNLMWVAVKVYMYAPTICGCRKIGYILVFAAQFTIKVFKACVCTYIGTIIDTYAMSRVTSR